VIKLNLWQISDLNLLRMDNGRICSKCNEVKDRREFDECGYRDRKSQITPRCKECRSDDYYLKRYGTTCIQCLKPRQLNKNQVCTKCNEMCGLKECKICNNLLIILLHFIPKSKTCKECKLIKQIPIQWWGPQCLHPQRQML